MKIVFVITELGSFNNFLSELALELIKDSNIELHIICSNYKVIDIPDKNNFNYSNFYLHFLDIPRSVNILTQLKAAYFIRKILDKIKPDIVHSHFTTGTFPTILLKNNSYIYWATFHGLGLNSSEGFRRLLFSVVENLCFLRLNRIFLVNNEDFLLLNSKKRLPAHKYNCKGFGCDIDKFNKNNFSIRMRENLKNSLNVNLQFVICFTGRFVEFKGFSLVIKSFFYLSEKYPKKFKLILLGGKDSIHSCGLNEFEQKKMDSHQDIINIGYTSEVPKYLAISDVLLFPSKKEGLPTCVLESLSMGVPVIAMDSRGNNDLVKDGYNGFLIKPSLDINETILSIISSIEKLYYDSVLKTRLSNNAIKDRENFSRNKFIDEHKLLYSQVS